MPVYKIGELMDKFFEEIKNGTMPKRADWKWQGIRGKYDLWKCSNCGYLWKQDTSVKGPLEELHKCPGCGCDMEV